MILISIQFAIIIIGLIIGGMGTLLSIIFVILSLSAGKNRNAIFWSIGFVVSISVVIISVVQLVDRISQKVKTGVEWIKEHENSLTTTFDTKLDYNFVERGHLLDSLKILVEEKYKNALPESFYLNREEQIMGNAIDTIPFIYPYAFEYKDYNYNLVNVLNGRENKPLVDKVAQIAYDANYILLKVDKTNTELKNNEPEISYILFELRSGKQKQFLNLKKLIEEASAMGYKGSTTLVYLSDIYRAWLAQDYD